MVASGLTNQLFNMPLDCFVEARLYAGYPVAARRPVRWSGTADGR